MKEITLQELTDFRNTIQETLQAKGITCISFGSNRSSPEVFMQTTPVIYYLEFMDQNGRKAAVSFKEEQIRDTNPEYIASIVINMFRGT